MNIAKCIITVGITAEETLVEVCQGTLKQYDIWGRAPLPMPPLLALAAVGKMPCGAAKHKTLHAPAAGAKHCTSCPHLHWLRHQPRTISQAIVLLDLSIMLHINTVGII